MGGDGDCDEDGDDLASGPPDDCYLCVWPDLQKVPAKCGVAESRALFLRQMCAAGLGSWLSCFDPEEPDLPDSSAHSHVVVYILGTDQGGDQQGCHKLCLADFVAAPARVLYLRQWCLLHQLHLICARQLKHTDEGKYFGNLAKIVNVIRTGSNQAKLRAAIAAHGLPEHPSLGKLPPRPLKGRWLSTANTELWMLGVGKSCLSLAFKGAFGCVEASATHAARPAQADDIDYFDEDMTQLRDRLGRWTREALVSVSDDNFWSHVLIGHVVKGPVVHLQKWIMSKPERAVRELVHGQAQHFAEMFDRMLLDDKVWSGLLALHQGVAQSEHARWRGEAVARILESACDFHHRIWGKVCNYPYRILWLVYRPAEVVCEERQGFARKLLEDSAVGDATTMRFRSLFEGELRHAAGTGLLDLRLHRFVEDLASMWLPDTQLVEGANSAVKSITTWAPSISWELLASRLVIKQSIGGLRAKAEREAFVAKCVEHHAGLAERPDLLPQSHSARWSIVSAADFPDPGPARASFDVGQGVGAKACACALKFQVHLRKSLAALGIMLGPATSWALRFAWVQTATAENDCVETVFAEHTCMIVYQWRTLLWHLPVDTMADKVTLQAPLQFDRLWLALDRWHHEVVSALAGEEAAGRTSDLHVSVRRLQWDLPSFAEATALEPRDVCRLSDVCRCIAHGGTKAL